MLKDQDFIQREMHNFELDKDHNPSSIYFSTSKDANKLVEELMLLANRRVAEFIGKLNKKKPFGYFLRHDRQAGQAGQAGREL